MKIQKQKQPAPGLFLLIAFLIPVVGMLTIMLVGGYQPFGRYSMLYSDMYHQYYPFFVAYRKALLSGESLLYNWSAGMGMDYLSLISYYLGSPLNLLSVLMPEKWLLGFFSLLMPLKLGLASLFFALFLKKIFGKNDLSTGLFGGFYGLCAWALGYQWNIMWLDSFALLPLVALGTVCLLRDKKCILYTVCLFFAVGINYYIGFFVCIFVALLFFCFEICRWRGFRRFFADLCRIAFFSALAIGMTAFLTLPAYMGLQTTQSSVNAFPTGFKMNIAEENTLKGLFTAMGQVAGNVWGGYEPTFKEGLPNLYCGVGSVMLALLFLTSREVRLRDKLCAFFLLLFFTISFILRQLDYIWHGFHFTNMIPYRFSFLFSFVVLYMAYRAYLQRFRFSVWQLAAALLFSLALMWCSTHRSETVFVCYNGILLAACFLFLLLGMIRRELPADSTPEDAARRERTLAAQRQVASYGLLAVMAVELIANLVNFGCRFPCTNVSNYPKGTVDTADVIEYMQSQEDSLFYRAEVTHSQTLNDGALNGYYGVSTFTSSANVRVTEFMQALGYGAKNTYNRYCFEEASPVSNLFLNLKYMIERDGEVEDNQFFDPIYRCGNVYLLRNNAYLPLGFLANPELENVSFTRKESSISLQNRLFSAATGEKENVWHYVPDAEITADNATVTGTGIQGYCSYTDCGDGASVSYTFTAHRNGFLILDLNLPSRNSYTVYKNEEKLFSETVSLPQQAAVSDVCAGDVIEVHLTCKAGETSSMTIRAAITDGATFRNGLATLGESVLNLTRFSSTRVEGVIDCNRDGLLYTSIPQDGNWQATVDGEEAEIVPVGNAMCALRLTEGSHTVVFTYVNRAFRLGAALSGGCMAVFLLIAGIPLLAKRKRGKYDK